MDSLVSNLGCDNVQTERGYFLWGLKAPEDSRCKHAVLSGSDASRLDHHAFFLLLLLFLQ